MKIEEFLLRALADDAPASSDELVKQYRSVNPDEVWREAVKNRIESVVGLSLVQSAEAESLPASWREAVDRVEQQVQGYMAELDSVAGALAPEGIQLVALKNSGIARGIFPHLAGCPMGDVDVLVDPRHFRRAHQIILSLGYTFASRSPLEKEGLEEAERDGGAEYTKVLADGSTFWFELQWRPVSGRWIRPDQEPKAADLLARSIPIDGSPARLLAPEDNLLQVCLHTAKHTFVRAPGVRLHTDVDRIVRRCTIDWTQFVDKVEEIKVRTAVYLSLVIPTLKLGTPVPDSVLQRLAGPKWKTQFMLRWIFRVGLFDPDASKFSKPAYIAFNMMLYDDLPGFWRGVFPDPEWMRRRYNFRNSAALPFWHARRIFELLTKRART